MLNHWPGQQSTDIRCIWSYVRIGTALVLADFLKLKMIFFVTKNILKSTSSLQPYFQSFFFFSLALSVLCLRPLKPNHPEKALSLKVNLHWRGLSKNVEKNEWKTVCQNEPKMPTKLSTKMPTKMPTNPLTKLSAKLLAKFPT